MAGVYLEQYMDSLETLPSELKRNLTLMHDLDTRTGDLVSEVDTMVAEYLTKVKSLSKVKRRESRTSIDKIYEKCHEFADDKVNLANQTYELVDRHIRRLDTDLARYEAELKGMKSPSPPATVSPPEKGGRRKRKSGTAENKPPPKKKGSAASKDEPSTSATASSAYSTLRLLVPTTQEVDMPVDPNEPTYCICHQVSYGHMICCDNVDCYIEWFHFGCVDLVDKPKGSWYCPRCSAARKKT